MLAARHDDGDDDDDDVHFRANTLGKGMNPLIFQAMG